MSGGEPQYIFAYGSLMWRPDFPHTRATRARLEGYHRSLCHFSNHYRGTDEKLGLVFGLDIGGHCEGLAYEVSANDWPEAYAIVHAREMLRHTYEEKWCPISIEGLAERHPAICYVMNHQTEYYAGVLPTAEIIKYVKQGEGVMGRSLDYVLATHRKLQELGINDPYIAEIANQLTD
jgi:glutathione-specific gamma-glutamylcyclotransferase